MSTGDTLPTHQSRSTYAGEMRRGVVAALPLTAGVIPFGLAFAVSGQAAGFSPLETMLMTLLVFAGGSQVATISVTAAGGGPVAAVVTGAALNLRYVLYAMSVGAWLPRKTRPPRPLLAMTLSDESFGLATLQARQGAGSAAFLWGANLTMYVTFALGTLLGAVLGQIIPPPESIGLDVIFPMIFFALLLPMIRSGKEIIVAILGGAGAYLLRGALGPGPAILVAVSAAAACGVLLDRWRPAA